MSLASNFVGTLTVDVIKVSALPEKCDPYVVIKAGGNEVKTARKNDCRDEATFNQTLALSLDGSEDFVQIDLMDWDRFSSDDVVATTGEVPLRDVLAWGTGEPVWVNLERKTGDKSHKTKLRMKVTFNHKNKKD